MPSQWPHNGTPSEGSRSRDFDDAEKGLYDGSQTHLAPPAKVHIVSKEVVVDDGLLSAAISPIHEGITPSPSHPVLPFPYPTPSADSSKPVVTETEKTTPPPPPKKKKASKIILLALWFNTYRQFFTFIVTLNLIGMILAGVGKFHYAQNHLGALVLGNLLFAVLMRNELLLRILYMVAIYGLRSVRLELMVSWDMC